MVEELSHSHSLLTICIVVVAVAIFIYLRRLRIVPTRTGIHRVPTMKYFMTDEGQAEDGLTFDRQSHFDFPHRGIV